MQRKVTLAIGALLVTLGAALFALRGAKQTDPPTAATPPPAPTAKPLAAKPPADSATPAAEAKTKPRDPGAWARLNEKFGGSRTSLSQKVTKDIADVIDESMDLADMGAQVSGSKTAAEAAAKETVRALASQLGLSEDQQSKATTLVETAVGERLGAVKELATAMRDDPEAMMEMLLAGDAVSRNEMTQAEYDETTAPTRQMLQNIGGFLVGRNPGAAGAPLFGDEDFNRQLAAILTPEQQSLLAEYSQKMADQAAQPPRGGLPLQNGTIPVMDLEKLEQTIASAKLMTGGLRQLMEGMRGFQQNLPAPDGQ
jgi:hypothetical protein